MRWWKQAVLGTQNEETKESQLVKLRLRSRALTSYLTQYRFVSFLIGLRPHSLNWPMKSPGTVERSDARTRSRKRPKVNDIAGHVAATTPFTARALSQAPISKRARNVRGQYKE